MKTHKISLFSSILININIIIGAGLFINPRPLTLLSGRFGFLNYIIAFLILLPIVLSIAKLAQKKPRAGGLYVYAKEYLNQKAGFLCGWSYFLGKTTSAALLAHTFVKFFYRRIPVLHHIPILLLDCTLIFFLIAINIIGITIGGKIQYLFTTAKTIPIFFVIFIGMALFNPAFFINNATDTSEFFSAIPLAIFAFLSFEIICSIGHLLKHPQKNIKRSIVYSFFVVVSITTTFQLIMFGATGHMLSQAQEPVKLLAYHAFPNIPILGAILNALVFCSIIGGSFGSLTSNCWNLFALAKDKQLPLTRMLTKTNKQHVPYISLLVQGIIACILLALTNDQIPLQNMTVFGIAIAYLLNSFSAFIQNKKRTKIAIITPTLAIASSLYIAFLCFKNLFLHGLSLPFSITFLLGIIVHIIYTYKSYP
jgi:amino acid transporter